MNILDQLAEYSRLRVAEDKKKISLEEMKNIAIQMKNEKLCDFAFEKTLKKDGLSFICECKKASPSKGLIEPDFRYLEIAREYEAAGADCISVLTEPKWFLGSDEYLKEIAKRFRFRASEKILRLMNIRYIRQRHSVPLRCF